MNNGFNLNKSKFNILFFEYYTTLNTSDASILSEAEAMVNSVLYELNELDDNEYGAYYLSSSKFSTVSNKYDNVNSLVLNKDLHQWINDYLELFDGVFLIAGEENMNLYNLTKLIEKKNIKLFCSKSKGVFISSNKDSTYKTLKNIVKQPKTAKFSFNLLYQQYNKINTDNKDTKFVTEGDKQLNFESFVFSFITEFKKNFSSKLIIKPVNGIDCENITILESKNDLKQFSKDFINININNINSNSNINNSNSSSNSNSNNNFNEEFLIQEFIDGEIVSVSLIAIQNGNKTIIYPLSLNKQYIDLYGYDKYLGGEIPFNHPLKKEAFKTAISAVEAIEGLHGFLGVDLILTENEVFFIEVNSRFTTPYVALQKIAKDFEFNIIKTIIDLSFNPIEGICFKELFESNGTFVKFKKENNKLIIE
ncbi:ATP-grasp domain-containing protein [Methanobrevibacter curvatus]|uniref:Carbamoyl phosphate synthase-like protein n=1 Tax=Methanobrevibacter curvatus TaxID=49547 RepID=A0A166ERZ6_9EURY|nr:ATP-grasp domain-containing protein [Methanobrevibacter curvatus]KZX16945.1 carbamoyl phosphate synthase-like protein [Methanobrevibacter curvatus]